MIKYIARQKKDPIKGVSKFYAQVAPIDAVSLNEIGARISESCTVTLHDVKAVLSSLQTQIVYALRDGTEGAEALGALGAVLLPGFPPAIGDLEPPQLSIFN